MIRALAWRLGLIVVLLGGGVLAAVEGKWGVGLAVHAGVVGFLLAGTLNPGSRLFGKVKRRVDRGIWLTIDDGPDPDTTPGILDLLEKRGARATFFVIGEKAERYPELVRGMLAGGHGVGNHTWSHPQGSFWCAGPWRTWREITRGQGVLEGIAQGGVRYFRAPVGHSNVFVHPVLEACGLELVGWSSRGFDAVEDSSGRILERIRRSAGEGGIVLAHEGTPIAIGVVAGILDLAEEMGWEVVIPGGTR